MTRETIGSSCCRAKNVITKITFIYFKKFKKFIFCRKFDDICKAFKILNNMIVKVDNVFYIIFMFLRNSFF